jgi:hypothetical protein
MRTLTEKDTPFLRQTLEWWASQFPFPLDRTQLVAWAQQYPDEVINRGLNPTAGWYRRLIKRQQSPLPSEQDIYRYASAAMRYIDRARTTAEKLLGGAR